MMTCRRILVPTLAKRAARLAAVLGVMVVLTPPILRAQTADSLRLDQVIRDVINHNDRAAAARYMEEAARAKIGPAGAWDDPMLMLGVQNLPTNFDFNMDPMTMKMVGLSQNVPYAGYKGLQAKAAGAEAEAAAQERLGMEVDLVMAARFAYADLYYRLRARDALTAQHNLLNEIVASARSKLSTNQAGLDEVLGAEAELWRLQIQLLNLDHMVDEATFALNTLRGLDAIEDVPPLVAPGPSTIPETPEAWLAEARRNYPPLQMLARQAAAYDYSAAAARRMSWPMLGLSASYAFRSDTDMEKRDDMVGFQASFSLPIFAGRSQKQMAASMQAMRLGVEAEAVQKERELTARLRLLHTTAQHLQEAVDLYAQRIIPAAEDALQSALTGYAASRTPYTNVLMFAVGIFRDRLAMYETANQLARTMAEAASFTEDPGRNSTADPITTGGR